MKNMNTRTSAFEACGGRGPKCQGVWSDVDGERAVLCLDRRKLREGIYRDAPEPGDTRLGWKVLRKHLKCIRDHRDGLFGVVFIDEHGRRPSWDARPSLMMRLATLDEATVAFTASVVHARKHEPA